MYERLFNCGRTHGTSCSRGASHCPNTRATVSCLVPPQIRSDERRGGFHDIRREATTRWMAKLENPYYVKLITGHEKGSKTLEKVYDATKPDVIHKLLAKLQPEVRAS